MPSYTPPPAVGTGGLVYDGVTDNYAAINAALAEFGTCVIEPRLGQVAVSAPILLADGSGVAGFADVNPANLTVKGTAIVPTAGFNPALTAAQQALYPALGPSVSAPVVFAGVEAFVRGVIVSGKSICASAVAIGASQPHMDTAAFLAGTGTTLLDLGTGSGQGTMNTVVIRASNGPGTVTIALDIETADWLISNLRATGGSKIFNSAGLIASVLHLTGASTGQVFNTQIKSPCRLSGVYIDSGPVTDLLQVNLGNSSESAMLSGVEAVNNSAGVINNIINNLSTGTGGVDIDGLQLGSSSHNFQALLANAKANDIIRNAHLNSAHLASAALTDLFPNGTPGYFDVVTYS